MDNGGFCGENGKRNSSLASILWKFNEKLFLNISSISLDSSNINNPLSTKTPVSLFPIAFCINNAALSLTRRCTHSRVY